MLRRDLAAKRGSPLGLERERPRTGLTDEGLGTSPSTRFLEKRESEVGNKEG